MPDLNQPTIAIQSDFRNRQTEANRSAAQQQIAREQMLAQQQTERNIRRQREQIAEQQRREKEDQAQRELQQKETEKRREQYQNLTDKAAFYDKLVTQYNQSSDTYSDLISRFEKTSNEMDRQQLAGEIRDRIESQNLLGKQLENTSAEYNEAYRSAKDAGAIEGGSEISFAYQPLSDPFTETKSRPVHQVALENGEMVNVGLTKASDWKPVQDKVVRPGEGKVTIVQPFTETNIKDSVVRAGEGKVSIAGSDESGGMYWKGERDTVVRPGEGKVTIPQPLTAAADKVIRPGEGTIQLVTPQAQTKEDPLANLPGSQTIQNQLKTLIASTGQGALLLAKAPQTLGTYKTYSDQQEDAREKQRIDFINQTINTEKAGNIGLLGASALLGKIEKESPVPIPGVVKPSDAVRGVAEASIGFTGAHEQLRDREQTGPFIVTKDENDNIVSVKYVPPDPITAAAGTLFLLPFGGIAGAGLKSGANIALSQTEKTLLKESADFLGNRALSGSPRIIGGGAVTAAGDTALATVPKLGLENTKMLGLAGIATLGSAVKTVQPLLSAGEIGGPVEDASEEFNKLYDYWKNKDKPRTYSPGKEYVPRNTFVPEQRMAPEIAMAESTRIELDRERARENENQYKTIDPFRNLRVTPSVMATSTIEELPVRRNTNNKFAERFIIDPTNLNRSELQNPTRFRLENPNRLENRTENRYEYAFSNVVRSPENLRKKPKIPDVFDLEEKSPNLTSRKKKKRSTRTREVVNPVPGADNLFGKPKKSSRKKNRGFEPFG